MQGAEHQVAGFCRRERQGDGFQVAHFAHHDDVRVFTEGSAEGPREGFRVFMHFALVDVAVFGGNQVFDGVFKRDDVVVAVLVDEIHDRGQRGGFTGTYGARD